MLLAHLVLRNLTFLGFVELEPQSLILIYYSFYSLTKGLQPWCCWRCWSTNDISKYCPLVKRDAFWFWQVCDCNSPRNPISVIVSYPSIYLDKYPKSRCLFSITCHISEGHSHTLCPELLFYKLFSSSCWITVMLN